MAGTGGGAAVITPRAGGESPAVVGAAAVVEHAVVDTAATVSAPAGVEPPEGNVRPRQYGRSMAGTGGDAAVITPRDGSATPATACAAAGPDALSEAGTAATAGPPATAGPLATAAPCADTDPPLSVDAAAVAEFCRALRGFERDLSDAGRIDAIRVLEDLKAAAASLSR